MARGQAAYSMSRRDMCQALVGVLLAPGIAIAQGSKAVRRIGVLNSGAPDSPQEIRQAEALRELGWVEGPNLHVERRYDNGRSDTLLALRPRARLLTIPSCGVRFRIQQACYRVWCISEGAPGRQPEKNARLGGQRIYATQEIAHRVAKGELIVLIQCVQEPVAQDRGSALPGRGGNEVHALVLARQRLTRNSYQPSIGRNVIRRCRSAPARQR